jgi:hypothetical protein
MATLPEIQAAMTGFPRNLTWNDFRTVGVSPSPPRTAYVSSIYRTTGWQVALIAGVYRVRGFRVTVSLRPGQSWATSAAKQNNGLLAHEQGHYDITGLVARDLARHVLDLSTDASIVDVMTQAGNTPQSRVNYMTGEFQQSITRFGQRAQTLLDRLQSNGAQAGIYDRQTNHGLNAAAQTRWDNMFQRLKRDNEDFELWLLMEGILI